MKYVLILKIYKIYIEKLSPWKVLETLLFLALLWTLEAQKLSHELKKIGTTL